MSSFTFYVNCLLILLLISGVCQAQQYPDIKLNQSKIQYAGAMERKAILRNDSLLMAESWYLYGEQYEEIGDYKKAMPYFHKALRILEPRKNSYELVKLYVRLSETEQRQSHFNESLGYANLALCVAKSLPSERGRAIAYRMLGHIREFIWNGKNNKAEYDSVLYFYKQAEKYSYQLKDTLLMAESEAFLGALFLRTNPVQAISYLSQSLQLFSLKNDYEWQVRLLIHLSTAHQYLGKLKLSWKYLDEADKLYNSRHINEHGIKAMIESRYVTYFEETGQWKNALGHYKTITDLERKQILADREGALSRLAVEYETEKNTKLLASQKEEIILRSQNLKTQQRFTWAIAALFITAVTASFVFFRLYRKNQRMRLRNEELLKEQNHRVKNNLQVVSSLLNMQSKRLSDKVAKKAVEETRLRIESMAILHRKLYDGDHFAKVDLDDFIRELVQGVLHSYGYDHFITDFHIEAGFLPADKTVSLGLIINELTTNACKYAFPKTELPKFSVSCLRIKNKIKLTIADNGPGFEYSGEHASRMDSAKTNDPLSHGSTSVPTSERQISQKTSFGLSLIQAQVTQLNGASIFTSPKDFSGTIFSMEFGIQNHQN